MVDDPPVVLGRVEVMGHDDELAHKLVVSELLATVAAAFEALDCGENMDSAKRTCQSQCVAKSPSINVSLPSSLWIIGTAMLTSAPNCCTNIRASSSRGGTDHSAIANGECVTLTAAGGGNPITLAMSRIGP